MKKITYLVPETEVVSKNLEMNTVLCASEPIVQTEGFIEYQLFTD